MKQLGQTEPLWWPAALDMGAALPQASPDLPTDQCTSHHVPCECIDADVAPVGADCRRCPRARLSVVEVPRRRTVEGMLSAQVGELRRQLDHAQSGTADWLEAWEKVIYDVGDLIHRARGRPKGRRFVTVLELTQLLTSQSREAEGS